MRAYLSPGMRSALLSTVVYFTFVSVQPIFSQAKTAASPPAAVDSEQISRLNEKVAAQDQQLAVQQAQINALESGLAEQKALIGKLLQAVDKSPQPTQLALATEPHLADASLLAAHAAALRGRPPAAFEPTATRQTQQTVQGPPQTTVQVNALTNEQKEQPFPKEPRHWYDKYSERGYMQFRADNVVNTNSKYTCDQCDKGIGPNNTFFLRRMRLVLSGNVTDRISFYLQPDFASASGTSLNYAQLRDAYFDAAIDKEKTNRFRVGQSKIPYGFENMQSS